MKKLITLTTALFLSLASYAVSVNGTEFKFPNGNLDWSAPVEMTMAFFEGALKEKVSECFT